MISNLIVEIRILQNLFTREIKLIYEHLPEDNWQGMGQAETLEAEVGGVGWGVYSICSIDVVYSKLCNLSLLMTS